MTTPRSWPLPFLLTLLACACQPPNPDFCTPGPYIPRWTTVTCRLLRPDGGAAQGVAARCGSLDAGASTDATGTFSLTSEVQNCGMDHGRVYCGDLTFSEQGQRVTVSASGMDGGASAVTSQAMVDDAGCVLTVW